MKKQEAIQKAYGRDWETVKDLVNMEDGTITVTQQGIIFPNHGDHPFRKWPSVKRLDGSTGYRIRPESLRGIENNNGWIKVDIDNLPSDGLCFVMLRGKIKIARLNPNILSAELLKTFLEDGITHYQLITRPAPPIY